MISTILLLQFPSNFLYLNDMFLYALHTFMQAWFLIAGREFLYALPRGNNCYNKLQ